MAECELRKPGQDFCDSCPHKAVFAECLRDDGFVPRSTLTPAPSFQTRIGVFVLSALSMAMVPVVLRTLLRIRVEGDVSHTVSTVLAVFGGSFTLIVTVAAFYGLYVSVFSRRRPRVA